MNKNIITILVLIILIVAGVFLYATRAPEAPSQSIEQVGEETAQVTESDEARYQISQENSQVEFRIGEVLNDFDNTVIGVTSQIAGDIVLSGSTATIGTISINARTFKTDNEFRDGAIVRFILKAEDSANEFITFVPTASINLPTSFFQGESFNGVIVGNLTIAGITKSVILNLEGSLSLEQLKGKVSGTLKRSDFNLVIPQVAKVASVEDTFSIQVDIVANSVSN